jgi:uncharacterized protein YkwD
MSRHPVPVLVALALLAPARLDAQSAQHHEVEVIDAPPFKSPDEKKPDLAGVKKFITDRTNEFRESEKRQRVEVNPKLEKTARYFADYMARTGRYGHTADGSDPADRAEDHGYDYCIVLENIAYAFDSEGFTTGELGKKFFEGWKHSPPHRRNMLDADVVETGVAVARSEKTGYYFAVQMFGRPKSLAIEFRVKNRSPETVSYKVGDREFTLPPRYTRTHEQCRPPEVKFELPAGGKTATESRKAETGDTFLITGDKGNLRVERQPGAKKE